MANETVPSGECLASEYKTAGATRPIARILPLPCADARPVRQEGRRGRLPRTVTSLRRYRTEKVLAERATHCAQWDVRRTELDEARARLADAVANLKVVGMLLQELEVVAAEDR